MRPSLLAILLFAVSGCASTHREADAEARGYERGYQQAVKEQYWIIQRQQRMPAKPVQSATPNSP